MSDECQVTGDNAAASFTLKLHRGEGMLLLAMNWKDGPPPVDFVGFAIEYREPGGTRDLAVTNRLSFPPEDASSRATTRPSRLAPIQKFRWIHFPWRAELPGDFLYRVTPVFMNERDELSYGEPQEAAIQLRRETYPGLLNVAFTRGFVSSQAFVDDFESAGPISTLLPANADQGLDFVPTHPKADQALAWMGFEARTAILGVLDEALADADARVRMVAYDLNEPDVVDRLQRLGSRLQVIIDDQGAHGEQQSSESRAAVALSGSAGPANVKRQHMGKLQHNKTIVVDGPQVQAVVLGSTNFSWRGLFVQSNNVIVARGQGPVGVFGAAFDDYWAGKGVAAFSRTTSAGWQDLGVPGIDARVGFSPHSKANALLQSVAADVSGGTSSSLFYSLAFLYQTRGAIRQAIEKVTADDGIFVYGISDRAVGGLRLQKPDGNPAPVSAAALSGTLPPPFKQEPTGGGGTRMHHKFLVIDFDRPGARVYLGSYNFSATADNKNGENLVLVRDRRVATAYMVEALRIFDHYHFRVAQQEATTARRAFALARPPRNPGEEPWWARDYRDPIRIRDRELFA